jgi:hypothetical protein
MNSRKTAFGMKKVIIFVVSKIILYTIFNEPLAAQQLSEVNNLEKN